MRTDSGLSNLGPGLLSQSGSFCFGPKEGGAGHVEVR